MYSKDTFAPVITKHNIENEADFLSLFLKQDKWVIERLLREYWKDKVAIEWTINDIKNYCPPNIKLTDDEALEVLQNVSIEYSPTWGITGDDIEHSIEMYTDYKDSQSRCVECKCK